MKEAMEEWTKVLCKVMEQNRLIEEAKKPKEKNKKEREKEERKILEAEWMDYNQVI